VAFYGPSRAAVLLEPAAGRWPDHEPSDRLAIAVGVLAHLAQRSDGAGWAAASGLLEQVARALAAAEDGPLPGDLVPLEPLGLRGVLAVVDWAGPGRPTVRAELTAAAVAPAVVLRDPPPRGGPTLPAAALALLVALAASSGAADRLALAFAVEGVLGWYRHSHRLTAIRQASSFALVHVAQRLTEAGRPLPPGLG